MMIKVGSDRGVDGNWGQATAARQAARSVTRHALFGKGVDASYRRSFFCLSARARSSVCNLSRCACNSSSVAQPIRK